MLRSSGLTSPVITRRFLLGSGVAAILPAPSLLGTQLAHSAPMTLSEAARRPGRLAKPARPPPLVMLDPGHGGKDPGALGLSGTYEKHIALATAHELQRQLEATGHYRVEMTRSGDVFVPLASRVAYAQSRGA